MLEVDQQGAVLEVEVVKPVDELTPVDFLFIVVGELNDSSGPDKLQYFPCTFHG